MQLGRTLAQRSGASFRLLTPLPLRAPVSTTWRRRSGRPTQDRLTSWQKSMFWKACRAKQTKRGSRILV